MRKLFIATMVAVVALSVFAVSAKAEDNIRREKPENARGIMTTSTKASTTAARISAKCEKVNSKIDLKISNFDNGQLRRVNAFQNMQKRILNIVDKLTAKGVDTDDLKADLVNLDSKIAKLSQDYRAHIDGFRAAKDYDCGQSQGQFRKQINESRRQLSEVKKDVLDIRSFYSTTIKPDLIKARNAAKALKGTSTSPVVTTTASSSISQ